MENKRRVYAALVAAAVIIGPDGKMLIVGKEGKLTIPTGHMDAMKDRSLKEALRREMKEEIKYKGSHKGVEIQIMGSLGTMVRNKNSSNSKLIEIFRCALNTSDIVFAEKGETFSMWAELDSVPKLENLDDLGLEGADREISYLKEHVNSQFEKKGGENEGEENSQEEMDLQIF